MSDDQLGVIAVTLALGFPSWLQRRVEQVTYLDDITVAHHEGVMIRWPEPEFFPDAARPEAGQTIYVPLGLLTKGPLTGLDGTQPDGSPFPIMVSGRTRGLASSGITTLIWGLSEKVRGRGLEDEASLRIIDAIVTGPATLARTLLRTLDDPSAELGQVLPRVTELRGLLQELGESVLLLAPAVYRPGSEDVYRYTYSRPLPWESSGLGAAFGFADTRARVRELSLGQSASYHLAVEAPAEVRLARARLYGTYAHGTGLVTALIAEDGGSPVVDLHARRPTEEAMAMPDPAHPSSRPPLLPILGLLATSIDALEAARRSEPTRVDRSDRGYADFGFRPDPFGTFLAATVTSALTALLLLAASTRLPQLDGQISAGLLLALPVLALGYVTRPGEHSFATRLLRGVRFAAVCVGICALIVAGALAGGFISRTPAPAPTYVCTGHLALGRRRPLRTNLHCIGKRPAAAAIVVPAGITALVDVATGIAICFALILALGWLSTLKRPTGRLPEAGAP